MRVKHSVRWLTVTSLIAIVVLVLTGCRQQEQEPAAAPSDARTAAQPAEPPPSAPKEAPAPPQNPPKPAETANVPDDFPLPIYQGFTVKRSLRTQATDMDGIQIELIGKEAPETVVQFYESEFKKRKLEVFKRTEQTDTGSVTLMLGRSEKIAAGVAASKRDNQTHVILSWSEKK